MTPRFNVFFRWFAKRFFGHFDLDDATVARLRTRSAGLGRLRDATRAIDYFLFNAVFAREGLRLSGFANGVRFYYYRPLLSVAAHAAQPAPRTRRRSRGAASVCARAGARWRVAVPVPAHGTPRLARRAPRGRRRRPSRARRPRRDRAGGVGRRAPGIAGAVGAVLAQGAAGRAPLPQSRLRRPDASVRRRRSRRSSPPIAGSR